MKLIPDTSVVIDGRITSMIQESGEYKGATIIVPEAVIAELEAQANQGREIGFSGLTELQELSKLAEEGVIELQYVGERPSLDQVKLASGGEIDALIRKVALDYEDAKFITSDIVQSEVAKAKGLDVLYLKPQTGEFSPLTIDNFFDENTLAVFLKERAKPVAKKGTLKESKKIVLSDNPISEYELRHIAQEILERAKRDPDGFIEMEKRGITIVQIGSMRISIARRPFSDGMEIIAVRPIADMSIDDYSMACVVKKRLLDGRRGIIITGTPGMGKTTLAQSIALFLSDNNFSVKTMEALRDIQVPDNITQYTALEGSMENTAEVMLLMRPDYVIFDELRKKTDFSVFADMRLAGIGMVGVVHANDAHDALQRFFGKTEFGFLPQIIDTVIFVKDGDISKIYDIAFEFKVPESIPDEEEELSSRPVISVINSGSGDLESEIFRYDSEPIVLKFSSARENENSAAEKSSGMPDEDISTKLVEREIQREIGRFTDGPVEVKMQSENKAVVYIDDKDVPAAIGKGGKNVASIVNKLSIGIDIRPRSEFPKNNLKETVPEISSSFEPVPPAPASGDHGIEIKVDKKFLSICAKEHKGKIVDVFGGKEYLFTATVNDQGEIHMSKNNSIAMEMIRRYNDGEDIRLRPV
ncbi:ATPase [Methanomicrobium sp. W14]|uniref:PINc/VapC family ATPase n=1 Tax=Methanomicrobium sp. W14 TaxID=2817839 RepID=UPI001AE41EBD|nr:PINc/VapC family ATPase [Methanomicrobium sp. W14]MBP2132834.1 ATPase [Methanomicrobium sp. W14]